MVLPVHRNPVVRESLLPELRGLQNIRVVEPMSYGGFVRLMARSTIILTDSGGIQEEGPVSVNRYWLSRNHGAVRGGGGGDGQVGRDQQDCYSRRDSLLLHNDAAYDTMARAVNPYGDGHAAPRVVAGIADFLGQGELSTSGTRADGRGVQMAFASSTRIPSTRALPHPLPLSTALLRYPRPTVFVLTTRRSWI